MIRVYAFVFLLLFLQGCVNTPDEWNNDETIPSENAPPATNNSFNQYGSNEQPYTHEDSSENTIGNCENPLFTAYVIDPLYVQKVGQVGVVHGSGLYIVERSYISVKNEFHGKKVPIYAPVNMTLRSGSHYQNPAATETALPDYALWLMGSAE